MKIGVIGVGNMGAAIIKGCIASGMKPENIFGTGRDPRRTAAFAEETGIQLCEDIGDLVTKCDAVMIAVKPKDVKSVLKQAAQYLTEKKVVISIAAGLSVEDLQRMAEEGCGPRGVKTKIIRVMPNTPAMVGAGMSALCRNEYVTEEEFEFVMKIFSGIGSAEEVEESLMDAVTGVSGSGPAYVYLFIEALADGGVLAGLPRAKAVKFAAQTVLGSARMVLETGRHPGELKDAVCSPAGTTIEGVRALEAERFRHAVMSAVAASAEKSKNM